MTGEHATSLSTGRRRSIRRDPTVSKVVVVVVVVVVVGARLPVNVGQKGYAQLFLQLLRFEFLFTVTVLSLARQISELYPTVEVVYSCC